MSCPRCGTPGEPVTVHGHTQCAACGQVIDDCCQGERAQPQPASLPRRMVAGLPLYVAVEIKGATETLRTVGVHSSGAWIVEDRQGALLAVDPAAATPLEAADLD